MPPPVLPFSLHRPTHSDDRPHAALSAEMSCDDASFAGLDAALPRETDAGVPAELVPGRKPVSWTVPLFALWLVALMLGGAWMLRYQLTPGNTRSGSPVWPAESHLARSAERPTLLMFLHPQCPCSRASLAELETLVRTCDAPDLPALRLVFLSPSGMDAAWARSDLWSRAEAIPGAECVLDADGAEHRRFGAATSGETFLFDRRGELRFQGGITAGRGEAGDNPGRRALASVLTNEPATEQRLITGTPNPSPAAGRRAPVFGCSLETTTSGCPRCAASAAAVRAPSATAVPHASAHAAPSAQSLK